MKNSNCNEYNHVMLVINKCDDCPAPQCEYRTENGIPDACPYLLEQIKSAKNRLRNNPDVVRRLSRLENLSGAYDFGRGYSSNIARVGEQLLRCKEKQGEFEDKNILLLKIAALLHRLDGYNLYNYWHSSAVHAEQLLSQVSELSLYDKLAIIEAIEHHTDSENYTAPVSAALFFGNALCLAMYHFRTDLNPEEFSKLSAYDKQAFYVRDITFSLDQDNPKKGYLVFHYNERGFRAYGLPPEFRPELFVEKSELILGPRQVAMNFLGLDDVEILLSTRSSVCPLSEDKTLVTIPIEDFTKKK